MSAADAPPRYVIDTSVALKWFVETDEPDFARARQLRDAFLQGRCSLRAPELLPFELANALQLGRKFTTSEVVRAVESVSTLGDFLEAFRWITLRKAIEIASSCRATVYDSYFLALAIESDSVLVTADEDFLRKAHRYPDLIGLSQLRLPG